MFDIGFIRKYVQEIVEDNYDIDDLLITEEDYQDILDNVSYSLQHNEQLTEELEYIMECIHYGEMNEECLKDAIWKPLCKEFSIEYKMYKEVGL